MKIYVEFNLDGTEKFRNNFPFDSNYGLGKTEDELVSQGGLLLDLETIPVLPAKEGYDIKLFRDEDGSVSPRYIKTIPSDSTEIFNLKTQLANLMFTLVQGGVI